jgi:hypothetical protein
MSCGRDYMSRYSGPDGYRRRPVDRSNSASSGWLLEAGCNYSVTTLFLLRIVSIRLHVYYEKGEEDEARLLQTGILSNGRLISG